LTLESPTMLNDTFLLGKLKSMHHQMQSLWIFIRILSTKTVCLSRSVFSHYLSLADHNILFLKRK